MRHPRKCVIEFVNIGNHVTTIVFSAVLESFCSYDRLRELAEADKDGRVAVLPRRVGDIVWANLVRTGIKKALPLTG